VFFTEVKALPSKPTQFFFRTVNKGKDSCKTPIDMFEDDLIENDLVIVTKKIKEYYD